MAHDPRVEALQSEVEFLDVQLQELKSRLDKLEEHAGFNRSEYCDCPTNAFTSDTHEHGGQHLDPHLHCNRCDRPLMRAKDGTHYYRLKKKQ